MKRILYIAVAGLCLCACAQKGPTTFRGWYSFKTGGSLDFNGKVYLTKPDTVGVDTTVRTITIAGFPVTDTVYTYRTVEDTVAVRDTFVTRRIVTESGQMHILRQDGDSLVITMNITGGDPVVMGGRANGNDITVGKTRRFVPVFDSNNVLFKMVDMTVSGSGKRYDNMVILDFFYEGEYSEEGFDGTVSESRVNCIATENE